MNFSIKDPGLRFPKARTRRARTSEIIVHHLDAQWDIHRTHQFHISRGWNGIGYNFHVAKDGTISLGRGMEFVGAHTNPPNGANSSSIGIGCEGQYHSVDRIMPDAQFNALVWLIKHLRGIYGDIPVRGHRDLAATACPGQFFPLAEVQRLQFRGSENTDTEEVNNLTEEQVREIVREELRGNGTNISSWAAEAGVAEIIEAGISDGTRPGGRVTREEVWTMFVRFWKMMRGTDA